MDLSFNDKVRIAQKGILYRPASTHYSNTTNPIVDCDNCGRSNLVACIGLEKYDLCLCCAENFLNKRNEMQNPTLPPNQFLPAESLTFMGASIYGERPQFIPNESLTLMGASMYTERPVTRMETSSYKPINNLRDYEIRTEMQTNVFRPNESPTYMGASMYQQPLTKMGASMYKNNGRR